MRNDKPAARRSGSERRAPGFTPVDVRRNGGALDQRFEAKVATGQRRERTLDHYRSHLRRHLLPRLGRRRLQLITADHLAAVVRDLQAQSLSPGRCRECWAR